MVEQCEFVSAVNAEKLLFNIISSYLQAEILFAPLTGLSCLINSLVKLLAYLSCP